MTFTTKNLATGVTLSATNSLTLLGGPSSGSLSLDTAGNAVVKLGDNAGSFSFFVKDSSNVTKLKIGSAGTAALTGDLSISSLTSGRLTYAGVSGLLQDSSNLTFDGTTLTVTGNTNVSGTLKSSSLINGEVVVAGVTGALTSSEGLQFDGTYLTAFSIKDSSLTSGRLTYAGASGLLRDNIGLTFDGTYLVANSIKDSALTSGRLIYAGTAGLLQDSANLTFNGTTLNLNAILDLNSHVISNLSAPVLGTDAVNKAYADSLRNGIQWKQSVRLGTAAVLAAYTPAGSGIGKTLTANANALLVIDGVNAVAGNRVLVKNEIGGNAYNNGIYIVTAPGADDPSGSLWVLTRATDADENAEVMSGMAMFIDAGSVNADSGYVLTTSDPLVVDTTSLSFTRFSTISARTPVASDGITVVNDPFSATISARADTTGSVQSILVNPGSSPNGIAVKFDSSGALSATSSGAKVNVDGSTISISGNAIYVPAGGITDTQLSAAYLKADGSVGLSADWNAGSHKITAQNFTDTSLTSGRVTYAGTGGLLQDSTALTFDGKALTVAWSDDLASGGYSGFVLPISNYPSTPSTAALVAINVDTLWAGDQDSPSGSIISGEFRTELGGSANIDNAVGIHPWIRHQGTGHLAGVYGVEAQVFNQGGGTISNSVCIFSQSSVSNSSSITNVYGINITTPSISGGGSITNNYGLYIGNQTGATGLNYSIYSEGGSNYFGGLADFSGGIKTDTIASHTPSGTITINGVTNQYFQLDSSGSMFANLGDNAGADFFRIRASSSALCFGVDSIGNARVVGNLEIDGSVSGLNSVNPVDFNLGLNTDNIYPHTSGGTVETKTDGGSSLSASDGTVGYLNRIIHVNTTDATPTVLTFDGTGASSSNIPSLSNSTTHGYTVTVTGRDTSNNLTVAFVVVRAVLERAIGGTVSLLATATDDVYQSDLSIDVIAIADDVNKGLNIQVTGLAATNITWKAYVVETQI